jgi:hypothetical protein
MVASSDSRSSAEINTTYSRPFRVMCTRSWVRSTSSATSESLAFASDSGMVVIDQNSSLRGSGCQALHVTNLFERPEAVPLGAQRLARVLHPPELQPFSELDSAASIAALDGVMCWPSVVIRICRSRASLLSRMIRPGEGRFEAARMSTDAAPLPESAVWVGRHTRAPAFLMHG